MRRTIGSVRLRPSQRSRSDYPRASANLRKLPLPSKKAKRRSVRPVSLIPERIVPTFHTHNLEWREGRVVELVNITGRHCRVRIALIELSVERPPALAIRTIHSF